MEIILYKTKDKKEVVNKNLLNPLKTNITLNQELTNISKFSIIINYSENFDYNYCYVDKLKRYYYIEDIEYLNGNRIRLNLRIDVLMSHKEFINNVYGILDKSTNNYSGYLIDNNYKMESYKQIVQKTIGNTSVFEDNIYLLTVGGGDNE